MAPTPNSNNGLIRLSIVVDSLTHKQDWYVKLNNPGVADYSVVQNFGGTGADAASVAAQAFWTAQRGIWYTSIAAPQYEVFWNDAGILIPVLTGACTGAGQKAAANRLGTQLTVTMKDATQHLVRYQFMEASYVPPSNDPALTADTPITNFCNDVIAVPDGTVSGTWARSRAGLQPIRPLFASVDTNDKLRRARGL